MRSGSRRARHKWRDSYRVDGGRLVDVARATLHRPDLLILDEPTVGLDPEHREQVWAILNAERRDRGTTILFSTHYLLEAEPADRAVLLANGEVVADGAPAELRSTVGDEVAEVEGPGSARLVNALREAGVVVSVQTDRTRISSRHPGGAQRIRWSSRRAHAISSALSVRPSTLEDVYFTKTVPEVA